MSAVLPQEPEWNVKCVAQNLPVSPFQSLTISLFDSLNRHIDSWDALGRAYWVTRNSTYSTTWVNQVTSWINSQTVPPSRSNSYGSSWRTIDTGLRMEIAWPRAWYRFINTAEFDTNAVISFVKSVWEQGNYLSQFPSSDGNWLAHEMAGLYSLAAFWPELNDATSWRDTALDAMVNQVIAEQILPDGAHYELSTGYHYVVVASAYIVCTSSLFTPCGLPISGFVQKFALSTTIATSRACIHCHHRT